MTFCHVITTSKPIAEIPSQKAAGTLASQNRALVQSLTNPNPADGSFTLYRLTNLPLLWPPHPPKTSMIPYTIC
jgi:hypothetical protein